jgi:large subunit ribosomal protein L39e
VWTGLHSFAVLVVIITSRQLWPVSLVDHLDRVLDFLLYLLCSHKTLRTKKLLAVAKRRNRPLPQWIRMRTDNTIRYNAKRRHWRRTKLGL